MFFFEKWKKKKLEGLNFATREGILGFLVKTTGSIMGNIDRLVASRGLEECPIERVGGYAYYLVYSAICSAEKQLNTPPVYINMYRKEIYKAHASKPESVSFIEEYYEKNRRYYELVLQKNADPVDTYFKLSKAFWDIAYDHPIQNDKLRHDLIKSLAGHTQQNYPKFVSALPKLLSQESCDRKIE